jgi:hypothetical protein
LIEAWCKVNHNACEPLDFDELIANDCRFYDATCNGGEVPDPYADAGVIDDRTSGPPQVGTPDAAMPMGMPSNPTGGSGGSAPPTADGPMPVHTPNTSSGCSTTTPGVARHHVALLMLLFALIVCKAHSRRKRAR